MDTSRRTAAAVLVAAALFALPGCLGKTETSDKDIETLRVEQVNEYLAKEGTLLIDVRRPELYDAGHIPGALSIPLPTMRANDPQLLQADRLIVYAGGWTDPLSVAGTKRLIALGYGNVYEFKGGTEVWQDSGGQLARSDPDMTARPDTDRDR